MGFMKAHKQEPALRASKNSMSRKAFTLVEVMVASILIAVVGLSLLQMHQNSAEMSYKMQQKFKHSDWIMMAAFEPKLEKVTKNTRFDTLMRGFNIDKRPIREGLNHKVKISTTLKERINASDISKAIEEESDESASLYEGFRLEVYEQNIHMGDESYSVYRVIKP